MQGNDWKKKTTRIGQDYHFKPKKVGNKYFLALLHNLQNCYCHLCLKLTTEFFLCYSV